ncbi:MAG TPA: sulfate ABC transporter permease subunit [Gaiellales bacterium]
MARFARRFLALGYLGLLIVLPLGMVFWRALEPGLGSAWDSVTSHDALHALYLSLVVAVIATVLNTVFGIVCALWVVRRGGLAARCVEAFLDIPLAISPVVVGLALLLLYGRVGWLGPWLSDRGIQVLFAWPSLVLATVFVSLPFVARETIPVLRELGDEQEQAAATLGAGPFATFRRITLPAIRPAVQYGIVLTAARSLGEFGAVTIVSGDIVGKTQTLPLEVQAQFEAYDLQGAYAASLVLALCAVLTLVALTMTRPRHEKEARRGNRNRRGLEAVQ